MDNQSEEIAVIRSDWNSALDRAADEIKQLREAEQRLKERTIERDYHMRMADLLVARIRAIEPALEDSNSLLTAMLLEKRPDEEIEAQIIENRNALAPSRDPLDDVDRACGLSFPS